MKYAPVDFNNGTGMDRTKDEVFDKWFGRVHRGPGECDEVWRYADIRKLYECIGLRREVQGMMGNG